MSSKLNIIITEFLISLRLGFFLSLRDIGRASKWTTILITFVMTLTFLNLIAVRGILVGLAAGISETVKQRYSGDIIVSTLNEKDYIIGTQDILSYLKDQPEVSGIASRYIENAKLESNYKDRKSVYDEVDYTIAFIAGIDPEQENKVSSLANYVVEGKYLTSDSEDEILVGSNLLFKYSPIDSPNQPSLKTADLGSKVRLTLNGHQREVTIVGIVKTKLQTVDQRIYMNQRQVRKMIGREDLNVDEIAIHLSSHNEKSSEHFINSMKYMGFDKLARIQTAAQAEPKFLADIKMTFNILGNLIGSVGLIVATITIFIVIFVNAVTRRRFIGVLKGVGVSSLAIEISYVFQSAFYAFFGIASGTLIIYLILVPYFNINPINFPFSDGILVAEYEGTFIRAIILFIATTFAGFIPARIIVKQNTLDAILGR